jgi:hypothetical protein
VSEGTRLHGFQEIPTLWGKTRKATSETLHFWGIRPWASDLGPSVEVMGFEPTASTLRT